MRLTVSQREYDSLSFQLVADEGGFDIVCRDRRWTKIALQMGFAPGKAVGSHLRGHYEKILYPYNLFQSGANLLVSWTLASMTAHLVPDDARTHAYSHGWLICAPTPNNA